MFADSFYSAVGVLWEKHGDQAAFRENEILVLLSMDPESEVVLQARIDAINSLAKVMLPDDRKEAQRILAQLKKAKSEVDKGNTEAINRHRRLNAEFWTHLSKARSRLDPSVRAKLDSNDSRLQMTRGIVVHPAVVGRELAWSATRVDFWFNQIDLLSREATKLNGGTPIPKKLKSIPVSSAGTWQFYERDSVIRLGAQEGAARKLIVASHSTPEASSGNHFSISMFGRKAPAGVVEAGDGMFRLEALEKQMDPLLDWLAKNHHDFMRLNDFSESFSLLRWLRSANVEVKIINMKGDSVPIATPDRIEIDKGPRAGIR